MKCLFRFVPFLFTFQLAIAQVKIGDNATTVNPRSLLELESTTKGLLLPRMTNQQITEMTGVPMGMLVFSSTDSALYLRRDTGWAILSLAPNRQSATNQWITSGGTLYNTTATKVGIGTTAPFSQLSNTSDNIIDPDNYGGGNKSLAWSAFQQGYIGQLYNSASDYGNANGLLVKVASPAPSITALCVSQGVAVGTSGTPLLIVKGDGKVGINKKNPTEALDVTGNIKYSGNLLMGVQYVYLNFTLGGNGYATVPVGCPTGTKLLGGGGGSVDNNGSQISMRINYSGPDPSNNNAWMIKVETAGAPSTATYHGVTYAICAKVQ